MLQFRTISLLSAYIVQFALIFVLSEIIPAIDNTRLIIGGLLIGEFLVVWLSLSSLSGAFDTNKISKIAIWPVLIIAGMFTFLLIMALIVPGVLK